jgi:hypothetical protein
MLIRIVVLSLLSLRLSLPHTCFLQLMVVSVFEQSFCFSVLLVLRCNVRILKGGKHSVPANCIQYINFLCFSNFYYFSFSRPPLPAEAIGYINKDETKKAASTDQACHYFVSLFVHFCLMQITKYWHILRLNKSERPSAIIQQEKLQLAPHVHCVFVCVCELHSS